MQAVFASTLTPRSSSASSRSIARNSVRLLFVGQPHPPPQQHSLPPTSNRLPGHLPSPPPPPGSRPKHRTAPLAAAASERMVSQSMNEGGEGEALCVAAIVSWCLVMAPTTAWAQSSNKHQKSGGGHVSGFGSDDDGLFTLLFILVGVLALCVGIIVAIVLIDPSTPRIRTTSTTPTPTTRTQSPSHPSWTAGSFCRPQACPMVERSKQRGASEEAVCGGGSWCGVCARWWGAQATRTKAGVTNPHHAGVLTAARSVIQASPAGPHALQKIEPDSAEMGGDHIRKACDLYVLASPATRRRCAAALSEPHGPWGCCSYPPELR